MAPDSSRPAMRSSRREVSGLPAFSRAEVAAHSTPSDCWVVVRGKVYDVTEWIPNHPGGSLITVAAGKDCTQLFDSYHPLRASNTLPRFLVGDLKLAPEEVPATSYEADLGDGEFYNTLKRRVEAYFKDNKLDPRFHPAMYVKSGVIMATLVGAWLGAFFLLPGRLWPSLLCAALVGVAKAEIGVSIMHDANHGAYSRSPALNALMGATCDLAGSSSYMWRQQHVVGHHAFTNVVGSDPDIHTGEPGEAAVFRLAPQHSWAPWHAAQHLYLSFLYSLLAVKSIYVDDFKALATGVLGPVHIKKPTRGEAALLFGFKALYVCYMLLAPALLSPHSLPRLLLLWTVMNGVTGLMLAFMFVVAHVADEVAYLSPDAASKRVPLGWAAAQVATTADFCHGSWFWTHISGGLNHQVVHHLFPGICHCHYPQLAPIVMRTAAEFGVPYTVFPSFTAALASHFRQLRKMGAPLAVPSLATVG